MPLLQRSAARRVVLALAACASVASCLDAPVSISAPGASQPSTRLSELGVFVGAPSAQRPAPGFVAYDVNVPLYADGAHKRRYVYLPPGATIHATDGRWEVPTGAIFVKTFYFPRDERDPGAGETLLETRFLVRTAAGYTAATYVWNSAQTDAVASGGNVDLPVSFIDTSGARQQRLIHVPGTSQCQSCHGDRALGWTTRQLDHAGSYDDHSTDQLAHLIAAGLVDARPPATEPLVDPLGDAPLDRRARSYLASNCGHCHSTEPGSSAAGTRVYWDYDNTVASLLPLCRATHAIDGRDRVIVPGQPDASEVLARMRSDDPFARMPRGPSRLHDSAGIEVVAQWIAAMSPAGCR